MGVGERVRARCMSSPGGVREEGSKRDRGNHKLRVSKEREDWVTGCGCTGRSRARGLQGSLKEGFRCEGVGEESRVSKGQHAASLKFTKEEHNEGLTDQSGRKRRGNSCCCSIAKSCLTLCNPMDCSTPVFPVLLCLLEFAQTHVH